MKTLKIITFICLILALSFITIGLLSESAYSEKLIGSGVVLLFLVVFPLFSYYRWKGKDIKDYMLTKENLEKMRENQQKGKY